MTRYRGGNGMVQDGVSPPVQAITSRTARESGAVAARGLQRSEHRLLLLAGDALAATAALFLALWAWSMTTGFAFDAGFLQRSIVWLIVVPIWTILLSSARRLPAALSLASVIRALPAAALVVLGLYSVAYFYAPRESLPRLPALYFVWEAALITLAWRLMYLFAFTAAGLRRRAIVLGTGPAAARIIALLRELSPDVEVVAAIADGSEAGYVEIPTYAPVELNAVVSQAGVSEIIVSANTLTPDVVQDLLKHQERGVAVVPMSAEYEQLLMRVPVSYLPLGWTFTSLSEQVRARDASNAVKRMMDIAGALVALAVLVAVLPIVALAVWLDSGWPLFYRQVRLGAGGREFRVIKFRSMVRDAEGEGPRWADARDARITRVGRWLRRSRLDELPQVLNVLRGEMSLVGPRPERPEFVGELEQSIPVYRARLMVRPGLTGWAQVNADYAASTQDASLKLEYDLYYIKHRSFLFDAWILFRTAMTLLAMSGR